MKKAMNMYDIIQKKRDGFELNPAELEFWIRGMLEESIPDYQTTALLMAIYLNGFSSDETFALTGLMVHSGDIVDLSNISGCKVDKHSTGGVGDKTSLLLGPMIAATGLKFAKISGRGLGHTGGTLDKLEAIPGFRVAISPEEFSAQVEDCGLAIVSQSERLVPADKKLYALRDVTATVESIPLIAASIMCKKLAVGADVIILDVKYGRGAFMKTAESALQLAETMIEIGEHFGRRTAAVISSMDNPLGMAIGNALEIDEVLDALNGEGPKDLTDLCTVLCAEAIYQAGEKDDRADAAKMARKTLKHRRALKQFGDMVEAQGGDWSSLRVVDSLTAAPISITIGAEKTGYIIDIDAMAFGIAARDLGAGRLVAGAPVDHHVGIVLHKKPGDKVEEGEPVATLYGRDIVLTTQIGSRLMQSVAVSERYAVPTPLIYGIVDKNGFIPYDAKMYED